MGIKKSSIIILAGGFGTRLQSISNGIPKLLMPVGSSVYIDILLDKIFKYDFSNVYLSLHYKPELFHEYIENSIYKSRVTTIIEPSPLGTGGAVNFVIQNSSISSPYFVMNGDSLSDINLDQMIVEFFERKLIAMIGISLVKDASRYGTILEECGIVKSFDEKSVRGRSWINNGHYIFKKEVFDGFCGAFSLERDLFPKLAEKNRLGAFKVNKDKFIDMGIPHDYAKLCEKYKGIN